MAFSGVLVALRRQGSDPPAIDFGKSDIDTGTLTFFAADTRNPGTILPRTGRHQDLTIRFIEADVRKRQSIQTGRQAGRQLVQATRRANNVPVLADCQRNRGRIKRRASYLELIRPRLVLVMRSKRADGTDRETHRDKECRDRISRLEYGQRARHGRKKSTKLQAAHHQGGDAGQRSRLDHRSALTVGRSRGDGQQEGNGPGTGDTATCCGH